MFILGVIYMPLRNVNLDWKSYAAFTLHLGM